MLKTAISLVFLSCFSLSGVFAQTDVPKYKAGNGYELVKPSQPTQDPDKVEVIEFFWYGCPHCYRFEPILDNWQKNLPENVAFVRQPAIFGRKWAMHAKAYFTADALGIVDKVHKDLFDAIQNKKQKLQTEEELAAFFAERGVSETEFRNAFSSFIVDTKMRQAGSVSARYGVTGVPAIIVNGRYRTGGSEANGLSKVTDVIDFLIAKESGVAQK